VKRYLYFFLVILCVTHAVLATLAVIENWCRAVFIWIATAAWFIWPVILWLVRARKWRLRLPLLIGFVALFPAAAMSLIWFLVASPYIPMNITAKRFTGHGDAGQFILRTARDYGAVPRVTNGLPRISVQWRYTKYDDGTIEMTLPVNAFPDVRRLLKQMLGPPQGSAASGWYFEYDLSTNGARGANLEISGGAAADFKSTDVEFCRHRPPSLM
jgi:hypothetical protein